MIYITADLHLNHTNIIKEDFGPHNRSGFSCVQEMNDRIVSNWKSRITDADMVYILGDIALGDPTVAAEMIADLPGKKILIMGNHDVPKIKTKKRFKTAPVDLEHLKYPVELFEKVYPKDESAELQYGINTFEMSHWPPILSYETQIPRHRIYLHAHSHSKSEYNMANMALHIPVFDVGVDANNYMPLSVDELYTKMLDWTKEGHVFCDRCGSVMKPRNGPYGVFLGCSNYPKCNRIFNPIRISE